MLKRSFPPLQAREESRASGELLQRADGLGGLPYQVDIFNEPTVESAQNGTENLNRINGRNFPIFEPPPPLDLVGGGAHRFPGAQTTERRRQAAAAIDAELGIPGRDPTVSTEGVKTFLVPRARRGTRQ